MPLLTRYVLFDLMKVFLMTLVGMTALIFLALVGKEAIDRGMGPGPVLRMIPYLLPQAMQYAVPGAMLLATTNVYGRLAAYNEIVAMKSMGVSPWALAWPTFILAAGVSLGAVALNDIAVSWGRLGVERVFLDSLEEVVYGQLRVHRSFANDQFKMTVRRVDPETRRLIQPTVTAVQSGDKPPMIISAEWAELESRPQKRQLAIRFHNFELDGPLKGADPSTFEHIIDLDRLVGGSGRYRSPSTYSLAEIGPAAIHQEAAIHAIQGDMTASAAFAMLTGEFEQLAPDAWSRHEERLRGAEHTMHRLQTEPYRRWSNGFSCLAFVMVGVPVAVLLRKGDFLASFFACFAPILIVYYPLLIVSVKQAKEGALPPQAVWIGNLVLVLAGWALMRRVARY